MTTTLLPPDSAAALRILPISANLLPPEIIESRQGRRTRYAVLGAIVAVVVILAAWYVMAVFQTGNARDALSAAQAEGQRLPAQQKAYGDLIGTRAKSDAIAAELHTLLANDLPWSTLLGSLRGVAPRGVTVTDVTGVLIDRANRSATTLPGLDSSQTIGTLTIEGTAPNRTAVASYMDALSTVPGLANLLVTNASMQSDAGVTFTLLMDITRARLGGRFASPGPSPTAVK